MCRKEQLRWLHAILVTQINASHVQPREQAGNKGPEVQKQIDQMTRTGMKCSAINP